MLNKLNKKALGTTLSLKCFFYKQSLKLAAQTHFGTKGFIMDAINAMI